MKAFKYKNKNTGMLVSALSSKDGFTLLEILIAITLLSFLMIGVYTLVDNSSRTRENTLAEDKEFVEAETAFHRLEMDFSLLYTPLFYSLKHSGQPGKEANADSAESKDPSSSSLDKYEATERFPFISKSGAPIPALVNESKNSFSFLTSGNKRNFENTKESNFTWVKYTLDDMEDPNQPGLKALVRYNVAANPYAPDFDWDNVRPSVLLKNVKNLEFFFWDPQRKNFVDMLKNSNSDPNLIRIIKVVLEWVDSKQGEHKIERVMRITWPSFDTVKDNAEYNKALQQSKAKDEKDESEGTGPGGNPPPEDEE